jgi:hypothetical protein
MNILLVDQFSDPGGAQLCLRDLLPGFLERGWKPRLAIPGTGRLAEQAAEYGVPVHPLPISHYANGRKTARDVLRFGLDLPQAAPTIRRLIRRHGIDVAYINGPRPLPALVGAGVPVVFHSHSVLDKRYASWLASWALRAAGAGVIAVSRYVAGSWKAISRVQVVYTGVSDQLAAAPVRPAPTAVSVGIVGRIAPENGAQYADRTQDFPGKIDPKDSAYKLFKKHGWEWGGDWSGDKDYQHFSKDLGY